MDRIKKLRQKETRLVNKGYKAVDEGRERKADRVLGRAAKTENRAIKVEERRALPKASKGLIVKSKKK